MGWWHKFFVGVQVLSAAVVVLHAIETKFRRHHRDAFGMDAFWVTPQWTSVTTIWRWNNK